MHPLVLELTGKRTPQTGLEGKFSIYTAAALAIVAGSAGPKQFSDAVIRDAAVVALRDRVVATVTPGIGEAQVRAVITLKDGRRLEKFIEHVVGSVERPMSDADLDAKFLDLADGVLSSARAQAVARALPHRRSPAAGRRTGGCGGGLIGKPKRGVAASESGCGRCLKRLALRARICRIRRR